MAGDGARVDDEVFLKLAGGKATNWEGRAHFFGKVHRSNGLAANANCGRDLRPGGAISSRVR